MTVVCAVPFRIGIARFLDDPNRGDEPWIWMSFPLWIVLAVLARRGPPGWLPLGRRQDVSGGEAMASSGLVAPELGSQPEAEPLPPSGPGPA